jgi:hypothetical protein
MENLVIQVDDLDSQISAFKKKILEGEFLTEDEINLFIEKVAKRSLLNADLQRIREGEQLTICTFFINLCFISTFRMKSYSCSYSKSIDIYFLSVAQALPSDRCTDYLIYRRGTCTVFVDFFSWCIY